MYICICKTVTDKQIENAINKGACTSKQIDQVCSGVGSICGKCQTNIQQILDDNLAKQSIMVAA